jgi:hypothetical protein
VSTLGTISLIPDSPVASEAGIVPFISDMLFLLVPSRRFKKAKVVIVLITQPGYKRKFYKFHVSNALYVPERAIMDILYRILSTKLMLLV